MSKKLLFPVSLLVLLSLLLSACTPAQAPVVAPTEVPVQPTAVPPTEVPTETPLPPPDFTALFKQLVADNGKDKGYGTIAAQALNEALIDKAPFMLDVREPAELEKDGYIKGAVNIPVKEVFKNLDKLPGLDDPIVIYCASGHRGAYVFSALKLMGYTNVKNLAGGIGGWKKAQFPVETGLPAAAEAKSQPIVADQQLFTALDEYFTNLPEGFGAMGATKVNEELVNGTALALIDIRREDEYASTGYIEGAVNLPMETILDNLDKLPKDKKLVIYCVSGHRGGVITMALRMLGYDAVNMGGGLNAWKAAKLPVAGWVDWPAVWSEYMAALPADFYARGAADVNTMLAEKNPFLLDVREAAELEKDGFIKGAVNIPVRDLLKNLDKLPAQDQSIVIYCKSGHRGALALAALQMLGYKDVVNLGGGLGAWVKASLPVEKGTPAAPTAGTAPVVDETRLKDLDAFISGLPEGFFTVAAADLNAELGAAPAPFILDVRSAEELTKDGFIKDSVNVPVNELFAKADLLPKDKAAKIVVVCKSGHRGALAMMALRMTGYTDVRNLGGGMNAWAAAQLPVEK